VYDTEDCLVITTTLVLFHLYGADKEESKVLTKEEVTKIINTHEAFTSTFFSISSVSPKQSKTDRIIKVC
jgi:hypothetical protein